MYIVLSIVGLIAGALSGSIGFGGGMILLPVITYFYGVEVAVPVSTIAQMMSNLSRASMGMARNTMAAGSMVLGLGIAAHRAWCHRILHYRQSVDDTSAVRVSYNLFHPETAWKDSPEGRSQDDAYRWRSDGFYQWNARNIGAIE